MSKLFKAAKDKVKAAVQKKANGFVFQETVPSDHPDWVLVLRSKYSRSPQAREFLKKKQIGEAVSVFSQEVANTDAFRAFFETYNGQPFLCDLLYRRHLNPEVATYFPIQDFDEAMDLARQEELVMAGEYIKCAEVSVEYQSSVGSASSGDTSAGIQVAVPVVGGTLETGLRAGRSRNNAADRERQSLVLIKRNRPTKEDGDVWPSSADGIPASWFFIRERQDRGGWKGTAAEKLVVQTLGGQFKNNVAHAELSRVDMTSKMRKHVLELMAGFRALDAVGEVDESQTRRLDGTGFTRQTAGEERTTMRYKYTITMFDPDTYKALDRLSQGPVAQKVKQARKSHRKMSTNRWRNFHVQPSARQDLLLSGATNVPDGESNLSLERDNLFWTKLVAAGPGNYINIPITLYGFEGSGKTSVLGTWEHAAKDSAYAFYREHCGQYEYRIKTPYERTSPVAGILENVSFKTGDFQDVAGTDYPDVWHKDLNQDDVTRLRFRDTAPAKTYKEDLKGKPYTPGLLVLVVDATKVIQAADGATGAADWQPLIGDTLTEQYRAKVGAAADTSDVEELGVYPPVACLMAKANQLDEADLTKAVEWFKNKYGVQHVIPSPTFEVVTKEEREEYAAAEFGSTVQKEFHKKYYEVSEAALDGLVELINVIGSNEVVLINSAISAPGKSVCERMGFTRPGESGKGQKKNQ